MKIYFAGAIRGGRDDVKLYHQIINHIRTYGEVLTEQIGDENLATDGEINLKDDQIHDRDLNWISEADIMIAEVSTISMGVGYEIGRAIENNKKILCLFRPQDGKRLSAMVAGCPSVTNKSYQTLEEAKQIIDEFFKSTLPQN